MFYLGRKANLNHSSASLAIRSTVFGLTQGAIGLCWIVKTWSLLGSGLSDGKPRLLSKLNRQVRFTRKLLFIVRF